MKELELTLRMRNNRLKERRDALGMNQPEFAAAAGVNLDMYRELECLRRSPRIRGASEWRKVAIQLAHFHCVEPEELFPPAVLAIKTPVASRRLDGNDIFTLLGEYQQRLLVEAPDAPHNRVELREQVQHALAQLRPREAEALRLRFGLDDGEERTLKQVGTALDVTRTRAGQIETYALRKLRRAGNLHSFCNK